MKVIVTNSYDETCAVIANMIKELVNAKPDAKLGLATGGTPVPIYKKLIEMNKAGEVDFSRVHTVNLDEYCGIPRTLTRATAISWTPICSTTSTLIKRTPL